MSELDHIPILNELHEQVAREAREHIMALISKAIIKETVEVEGE